MMSVTIQKANQAETFARDTFFKETFIGDVLTGEEFIQPRMWQNERLLDSPFIWLNLISNEPWLALKRLGINSHTFRSEVSYPCEYEKGNIYYWMVPRVIIPSNWEVWKKLMGKQNIPEHAQDYEFFRSMTWRFIGPEDREEALKRISIHPDHASIAGTMMGHGYAPGFLPSDGSRDKRPMIVKLSDGSDLVCSCWIWYNK